MTCVSSSLMPKMNMFSLIAIFSSKEGFYADNVHYFHNFLVGTFCIRSNKAHLGAQSAVAMFVGGFGALDGFFCFPNHVALCIATWRIFPMFVEVAESLTH